MKGNLAMDGQSRWKHFKVDLALNQPLVELEQAVEVHRVQSPSRNVNHI
jgi:hypothetical protein